MNKRDERSHLTAFMAPLIEDVIAARRRLKTSPTQAARRDVVRASLAAIEGSTWVARDHVRGALADLGELTPVADLALRELSYTIRDNGQLIEQMRVLPLPTTVRLIVSQAKIISPEISVEFSGAGWSGLRQAIKIRNRITHPKPEQDLTISENDLLVVSSGLFWLQATVEYVMASTNLALAQYSGKFREAVQLLRAGDPDAWAAYNAALRELEAGD